MPTGRSVRNQLIFYRCAVNSQREPQIFKYGTKAIFSFLLISGVAQIGFGIGPLLQCRQRVNPIVCGFLLESHPCSSLAISAYVGCVVLVTVIFGFGCVGRKAVAILLLLTSVIEISLAIFMMVAGRMGFSNHHRITKLINACSLQDAGLNNFLDCWSDISKTYSSCKSLKPLFPLDCSSSHNPKWTESFHSRQDKKCMNDVNYASDSAFNENMHISGLSMLVNAALYIIIAPCLWCLQHKEDKFESDFAIEISTNSEKKKNRKRDWMLTDDMV